MADPKAEETEQEATPIDGMEQNLEDSFQDDPLSDIFDNEMNMDEPDPVVEPKETATEPVEKVETPDKEVLPVKTAEELTAEITGLNQALAAEREKKRVAQIENHALRNGQQKPEEPAKPEFDWTDPQKTIEAAKNEIRQESDLRFLNLSESQCKGRHEDYDAKYETFKKMAMANPSIVSSMTSQADPAEWAYQQAANHEAMQEFGNDPVAYKEKLTAEITANVLAGLKDDKNKEIESIIEQTPLPPSANKIKGKIGQDQGPVELDDPLGSVFGDR